MDEETSIFYKTDTDFIETGENLLTSSVFIDTNIMEDSYAHWEASLREIGTVILWSPSISKVNSKVIWFGLYSDMETTMEKIMPLRSIFISGSTTGKMLTRQTIPIFGPRLFMLPQQTPYKCVWLILTLVHLSFRH